MTTTLVLYDNAFSPYAFKVRATLYEKGIDHEKHEIRHASDREKLLAVNPRGEVPAITHGTALVYDSAVICEYLEAVVPEPPLAPSTPEGQARCRLIERMADGPLDGAVIALAVVKLFRPELQTSHPDVAPAASSQIRALQRHLDDELAGREYLCGAFSRADIALFPHIAGAAFLGVPPEGAHLPGWLERVSARPSVRRAHDEFLAAMQAAGQDPDPFFRREDLHVRDHRLEWCFRLGLGPWLAGELEANRLLFSPVP